MNFAGFIWFIVELYVIEYMSFYYLDSSDLEILNCFVLKDR